MESVEPSSISSTKLAATPDSTNQEEDIVLYIECGSNIRLQVLDVFKHIRLNVEFKNITISNSELYDEDETLAKFLKRYLSINDLQRIVSIFFGIGCSNQEALERFLPRDLLRRLSQEYDKCVYILLPDHNATSTTAIIQHDESLPMYFRDYCQIITCHKTHSTIDKIRFISNSIKINIHKRKKLKKTAEYHVATCYSNEMEGYKLMASLNNLPCDAVHRTGISCDPYITESFRQSTSNTLSNAAALLVLVTRGCFQNVSLVWTIEKATELSKRIILIHDGNFTIKDSEFPSSIKAVRNSATIKLFDQYKDAWWKKILRRLRTSPTEASDVDIYLSYKESSGKGIALSLQRELLSKYSLKSFVDIKSVFGFQEALRVVSRSRLFVAIFSHEYFESDTCWKELQAAVLTNKPILFLRDSNYTVPHWLPSHWNAIMRQTTDCIILCDPIYLKECAHLVSQVYHDAPQPEVRRKLIHASDIRTELMLSGYDHLLMKDLPPVTTVTPSAVAAPPITPTSITSTTYSAAVSAVMKPAPDLNSLEAYKQYLYGSTTTNSSQAHTSHVTTHVYKVDTREQSLADFLGLKNTNEKVDEPVDDDNRGVADSRPSVRDIMAKVDAYILEDTQAYKKDDDDWTSSEEEIEVDDQPVELPEEEQLNVQDTLLEVNDATETHPIEPEPDSTSASVPQDDTGTVQLTLEERLAIALQEDAVEDQPVVDQSIVDQPAEPEPPSVGFFLPSIDDDDTFEVDSDMVLPDMLSLPSQESSKSRVSNRISQLQDKIKFSPAMFATTGRPLKPTRATTDDDDDDDDMDDDLDDEDTPPSDTSVIRPVKPQQPLQSQPTQLSSLTKSRAAQTGKRLPSRKPRAVQAKTATPTTNNNNNNTIESKPHRSGSQPPQPDPAPSKEINPPTTFQEPAVVTKEPEVATKPQPSIPKPQSSPQLQKKGSTPTPSLLFGEDDFDFSLPKSRSPSVKKADTRSSLFDTTDTLFAVDPSPTGSSTSASIFEDTGSKGKSPSKAVKLFDDDDLFGSDSFLKPDPNKTKKKPTVSLFDE